MVRHVVGVAAAASAIWITCWVTTPALLTDPFCSHSGNPLGVTVTVFGSSVADSARSRCALSLASYLAAASIENCSFAGALTNRPSSSLARC